MDPTVCSEMEYSISVLISRARILDICTYTSFGYWVLCGKGLSLGEVD